MTSTPQPKSQAQINADLQAYINELEAGIKAYAQATLNRSAALLTTHATNKQRKEFIAELVVVSREQLNAFATAEGDPS